MQQGITELPWLGRIKSYEILFWFRLLLKRRQKKVQTSSCSRFTTSYWFIYADLFSTKRTLEGYNTWSWETYNIASFHSSEQSQLTVWSLYAVKSKLDAKLSNRGTQRRMGECRTILQNTASSYYFISVVLTHFSSGLNNEAENYNVCINRYWFKSLYWPRSWCRRQLWQPQRPGNTWEPSCGTAPAPPCPISRTWPSRRSPPGSARRKPRRWWIPAAKRNSTFKHPLCVTILLNPEAIRVWRVEESHLELDELAFHKPEDQAGLAGAHVPKKNLWGGTIEPSRGSKRVSASAGSPYKETNPKVPN